MIGHKVIRVEGQKTNWAYVHGYCCWMVTRFNEESGSVECVEEIFGDHEEVEELVKDGVNVHTAMREVARRTAETMAEMEYEDKLAA